jgi:hypothetical protein
LSIIHDHLYTNICLTWLELAAAATPAAPLPNRWAHGGQDGLGVLSMLDQENLTSLWMPLVFGTLVSFSGTWLEYASESPKNSGKTIIHSMKSTFKKKNHVTRYPIVFRAMAMRVLIPLQNSRI